MIGTSFYHLINERSPTVYSRQNVEVEILYMQSWGISESLLDTNID